MSKLSRFCTGLMESAWLTALVLIPVFFNRYSNGFDPDKLVCLRSLALVVLAAWLVRRIDQGLAREAGGHGLVRSLINTPLAVPLAVLALAYVVATGFSVCRAYSLWGSYESLQGTWTFFSFLVMLAAVAVHVRRPEQIARLITGLLVGSLPVALYAVLQRAGCDPVSWAVSTSSRNFSTAGQAIALAGYLAMVLPLSLWRILQQIQSLRQPPPGRTLRFSVLGFYVLLAAAQLAAFVFAESRGPFVGVLAGVALMCAVSAARWNRRRLLITPLGLAFLMLMLLNIPNGPLQRVRSLPLLQRFSQVLSPGADDSFRAHLWNEAPRLMLSPFPLPYPNGGSDGFHSLRPLVGYGPETLAGVLAHQYTVVEANPTLENQFHNLAWDLWASVGALGAVAFLALFTSTFFYAYRRLGIILGRRESILFWTLEVAFAFGGALVLAAWRGPGFAGLGLQVGLFAGLASYPLLPRRSNPTSGPSSPLSQYSATLLIALLSALAVHFVETGFSFEVAVTSTLFWIYTGVILALVHFINPATASEEASASLHSSELLRIPGQTPPHGKRKMRDQTGANPPKWSDYQPTLLAAVLTTFILVALLFSFIQTYSRLSLSAGDILSRSLTKLENDGRSSSMTVLLLLSVWVASVFALTADGFLSGATRRWRGQFWLGLFLSGGAAVVYVLFKAEQIATIGAVPAASASAWVALEKCAGYENAYLSLMGVSFGLLLLGGVACTLRVPRATDKSSKKALMAGVIASLGVLAAIWFTNLNIIRADICLRWADVLDSERVRPACIEVYRRAAGLNPRAFIYRSRLSKALRDQAEAAPDPLAFNDLMSQAEQVLLDAQKVSTLNRDALHLGDLYLFWALREERVDQSLELAKKASQAFEQALVFEPKTGSVWNESANVDLLFLNREKEGMRKNQKAIELSFNREKRVFGDFYAAKSRAVQHPDLKRQYAFQAMRFYDLAISNAISANTAPFVFEMAKGNLWFDLNDWNQALACYLDAATTAPAAEIWQAQEMLARAYWAKKDKLAALKHVELAIDAAPSGKKPLLLQFKGYVQKL